MSLPRSLLVVAALVASAAAAARTARQGDVRVVLKADVEALRASGRLNVHGAVVDSSELLERLYEENAFGPLWTSAAAVAALRDAVHAAGADGLDPADYHWGTLDAAVAPSPGPGARDRAGLDLLRTDALIRLAEHLRYGRVDPVSLRPNRRMSRRLEGLRAPSDGSGRVSAADSDDIGRTAAVVRTVLASSRIREWLAELRPPSPGYARLVSALEALRRIRQAGGWPELPAGPILRPGESDTRVPVLRRRLVRSGDLSADADTASELLRPRLTRAIQRFQWRHGLHVDGRLGPATLRELNVPVGRRIEQARVNLERMRWTRAPARDTFVLVNVAGAMVYFLRGDDVVLRSRAVVGRPDRETPLLRAPMRYLDLNPSWDVPPGMVAEVLDSIRGDPGYLRRNGIRLLGRSGEPVDLESVDFSEADADAFPYTLHEDPGPTNPLGRIKFVLPNVYNVSLHDTPARALFGLEDRALSHGCIRVAKALRLAELVLDDSLRWSRDSLIAAMAGDSTRTIQLERPVPVFVLYWTAAVDRNGVLHFARDVYGWDDPLLRALEERID